MRAKLILSLFVAFLLVGCFQLNTNLTPAGAKVQIVKNKPKGCKSLGKFITTALPIEKLGEEKTMNVIRNTVADEGGDTARLKDMAQHEVFNGVEYITYEGYAYKCKKD